MTYQFQQVELQNIEGALSNARVTGDYAAVYREILFSITAPDFSPKDGVDPAVWNWVNGALQVNENSGDYAAFIRNYSSSQYEMRFGGESLVSLDCVSAWRLTPPSASKADPNCPAERQSLSAF